jgi:NADP-dependent 3-hydroxy acid dehydrogenase YdfG
MKLTPGNVAVVTRAGSGIGRALALHLDAQAVRWLISTPPGSARRRR